MTDTAMGAALRKAGVIDDHERLRKIASDIHAKAGATRLGVQRLCKELTKDRALLEALAEDYLKKLPGEGQISCEAQTIAAQPRRPDEGEGGQKTLEAHPRRAPSPSPDHDGGGHALSEAQARPASPVVSPQNAASYSRAAKVIAIPLSKRTAATMASAQDTARKEWRLSNYHIPDGALIMQTAIANLPAIRSRLLKKGGDYLHGAVVVRALEEATAKYSAANPHATAHDVLTAKEIAQLEETISPEKVKHTAAQWMRKFPELDALHG